MDGHGHGEIQRRPRSRVQSTRSSSDPGHLCFASFCWASSHPRLSPSFDVGQSVSQSVICAHAQAYSPQSFYLLHGRRYEWRGGGVMHCDAVTYGLVDIVLEFPTSRCMVEAYPASARRTQSNQPIAYAGNDWIVYGSLPEIGSVATPDGHPGFGSMSHSTRYGCCKPVGLDRAFIRCYLLGDDYQKARQSLK
ncbi:hypothetical protein An02g02080 [Aspergillus niger]|uniref:Uncharacterized protein n=2 Tax=Aspergillus niger TaxID=5061 RepID=A2QC29_ASPNC|nr:hypothetical protein An02g02080 [Aspergillus niger]CAK37510.1 hypothetical protein An02g02080 [Aspergillus niger]